MRASKTLPIAAMCLALVVTAACTRSERTLAGAGIGGASGAVIGNSIGGSGGAVGGALLGGTTGAIVGRGSN